MIESGGNSHTEVTVRVEGVEHTSTHDTMGPVEALTAALGTHGIDIDILSLHQTSIGFGNHSRALTLLEVRGENSPVWVAGSAPSVLAASLAAVIAAAHEVTAAILS